MARQPGRNGAPVPSVEPCAAVHAEILALVHAAAFAEPWDAAAFRILMATPGSLSFLAQSPTSVLGFILGRVAADECEVLTIGVKPEARRKGVAGRLLDRLITAAAEAGARRIYLEVAVGNGPARRLYDSRGFSVVGRRPRYYRAADGIGEDAVVLGRDVPLSSPGRAS